MRNEYYDDHEQAQAVKKWIKDNAPTMIFGVVLGVGLLFGWRFYQTWQFNQGVSATESFVTASTALNASDTSVEQSANLASDYADQHGENAYAALLSLQAAQKFADNQDYVAAAKAYQQAIKVNQPKGLAEIARLRLARVEVQLGQLDQALSTLSKVTDSSFEATTETIRGDIYLAQGKPDDARASYQKALDAAEPAAINLIQLKLDDLAVNEMDASDDVAES